ncbi:phage antirepressor KilAC domain-containing protein [Enterococcus sp.]|uniref:phage antirepressor n=1 Tax=Enterococcus sp. TaxID=35783 RepID=UPI002896AB2A|nr:phage antirepressor KilAC domain-containing protein [Enterococcus sp.]
MTIQKFENSLFRLEVKTENGDSLFDVETVAKSLGISRIAASGNEVVRWDRVNKYLRDTYPQVGTGDFISEPMVYKLAFKANNALAEKFQDWLANEVLPSIRKHGAYMTDDALEKALTSPEFGIRLLTELKNERDQKEQAQQQLKAQEPQVVFAKSVEVSQNSVAVKVLATILKQNGVSIGQNRMFQWLREHKYLSSRPGKSWNMPTQKSMDKGLFELKANTYFHNNGIPETNYTPLVTGKGQVYFVNKFKNEFLREVAR